MNTNISILVIDMQKFPDEEEYKKLKYACENWGCFRVVNHGVPVGLMEEMKKVARCLLDLPIEIKKRNVHVTELSGYMSPSSVNPQFESLGIYDLTSSAARLDFFTQLDASPQHRQIMEAYGNAVFELTVNIAEKIKDCAIKGLSSSSEDTDFQDWLCRLKINKYDFTSQTIGSLGLNLHTDTGFLTILQDDEVVGGYEIMHPSSGSFVEVPPLSGTFFVNLGDVAHVWSNGRFPYLKHHVKCKDGRTRISIATHLFAPRHRDVEVAPEFVNCGHPPLFRPFNFESYAKLRSSKSMRAGEALAYFQIRPTNFNDDEKEKNTSG